MLFNFDWISEAERGLFCNFFRAESLIKWKSGMENNYKECMKLERVLFLRKINYYVGVAPGSCVKKL